MTVEIRGRDHQRTFIVLLLGANVLLLLAFFVQVTKQKQAAEEIEKGMAAVSAGQDCREALEKLLREHEVVLRERLQARLQMEEEQERADGLADRVARLEKQVETLGADLGRAASERDGQQEARMELERRLTDALDLLSAQDELTARADELDVVRTHLEQSRAEHAEALLEVERLRSRLVVLERLVETLRARPPVSR